MMFEKLKYINKITDPCRQHKNWIVYSGKGIMMNDDIVGWWAGITERGRGYYGIS